MMLWFFIAFRGRGRHTEGSPLKHLNAAAVTSNSLAVRDGLAAIVFLVYSEMEFFHSASRLPIGVLECK